MGLCNPNGAEHKAILANAGATESQKKALLGACLETKVIAAMADAKRNPAKYNDYLPSTCSIKAIDELMQVGTPSATKVAMAFATASRIWATRSWSGGRRIRRSSATR